MQDASQVIARQGDEKIQALPSECANEPFAERVGLGTPYRGTRVCQYRVSDRHLAMRTPRNPMEWAALATLGHPNGSMGGAAQHPRPRLEGIYQLLQCRIRYRFSHMHGVTLPTVFDRDGIRAHICGPTGWCANVRGQVKEVRRPKELA